MLRSPKVAPLVLVAMLLGGVALPASGDEVDDFQEMQSKRTWTSFADARPISPYFGIPGELQPTVPFARSYLDSTQGRSECWAALYYPDEVLEEGVLQTTGQYENRTMARSHNPDIGRGTSQTVAPLGMPGPHAATDNPSRTECTGQSVAGAGSEGVLVDSGFARTTSRFDGDALLVDEAISRASGITAGPLRIAHFESRLRLEYHLGAEPVVSYVLSLTGIEVDGAPLLHVGGDGITLAGEQVAARDLIDQFNAEVNKNGAALKEHVLTGYIHLAQPTVEREFDGGTTITAAAFDVGERNTGRENTQGSHFGARLGFASAYALVTSLEADGGLLPGLSDAPSDLVATPEAGGPSPVPVAAADGSTTPPAGFSGDSGLGGIAADTGAGRGSASFGGGRTSTGIGSGYGADEFGAGAADAALGGGDQASAGTSVGAPPVAATSTQALIEHLSLSKDTANGFLGGIAVLVAALVAVGVLSLRKSS